MREEDIREYKETEGERWKVQGDKTSSKYQQIPRYLGAGITLNSAGQHRARLRYCMPIVGRLYSCLNRTAKRVSDLIDTGLEGN